MATPSTTRSASPPTPALASPTLPAPAPTASAPPSTAALEEPSESAPAQEHKVEVAAGGEEEEEEEEEAEIGAAGTGAVVDMEVFGQLLEIDDDDTHEFSKTLAFDYISQANTTFTEIEDALNARDLDTLSRKGHFLKGSSAALGLQRVQHSCESMQHFGNRKDEHGAGELLSEEEALKRCRGLLVRLRAEQEEAREWLQGFYK